MIRIARAGEPAVLQGLRAQKLGEARQARLRQEPIDFDGYELVKGELSAMQHRTCCYCEKREEQAKYRDVEHYRPKSLYWWLAWTWENLLFACIDCNREQKRNQFPLDPASVPLVAEEDPPGAERPLVIDPSDPSIEPTMEIRFMREQIHGRERWVPRGLSPRGRETINVCGLDRPNLLDLYVDHVRHRVRPKLEAFFVAEREGAVRTAFESWERACRGLLACGQPFRALSYDALSILVPGEIRDRHRLVLERPAP